MSGYLLGVGVIALIRIKKQSIYVFKDKEKAHPLA